MPHRRRLPQRITKKVKKYKLIKIFDISVIFDNVLDFLHEESKLAIYNVHKKMRAFVQRSRYGPIYFKLTPEFFFNNIQNQRILDTYKALWFIFSNKLTQNFLKCYCTCEKKDDCKNCHVCKIVPADLRCVRLYRKPQPISERDLMDLSFRPCYSFEIGSDKVWRIDIRLRSLDNYMMTLEDYEFKEEVKSARHRQMTMISDDVDPQIERLFERLLTIIDERFLKLEIENEKLKINKKNEKKKKYPKFRVKERIPKIMKGGNISRMCRGIKQPKR
ncbi:MAG: hypothetical protein Harvfovirus41_6 [Harvfovirus sp.]|uniref:Uncharacterized protein n=1 Tax=Harvfovirus sp. TaxID=2487768 RepID=A0A3G5A5N6_9VIRU|nr:MAG: hypothetical protein Harvfovirus41_6 [Harvfovirus sp.]